MSVATQPAIAGPERYRLPIFWPSQIKLYLECPERYYHKYVARRRGSEPFSRDLARGIALHAVCADCFAELRASGGCLVDIRERVEFQLRQMEYPAELASARDEDADALEAAVKWVLSEFDPAADVVGVEETLGYYYRGGADCPACLFRAKVDLVLAHADGALEHLDFKGGKAKADPIQEVLSRVVVGAAYGERYPVVRTTTLFVAERKRVSDVLAREACRETWATIRRAVAEIQAGAAWPPRPSPFCGTCPYFGNGCSIAPEAGGGDAMADWLDGDEG